MIEYVRIFVEKAPRGAYNMDYESHAETGYTLHHQTAAGSIAEPSQSGCQYVRALGAGLEGGSLTGAVAESVPLLRPHLRSL